MTADRLMELRTVILDPRSCEWHGLWTLRAHLINVDLIIVNCCRSTCRRRVARDDLTTLGMPNFGQ